MAGAMNQSTYTDQKYWEKYYEKTNTDVERIKRVVGAYDKFWDLLIKSCHRTPKTVIEIGAYPGRYLAYLSDKYQLVPTSLDYNSGTDKIENCFKDFGIKEYDCIQADFMEHKPDKKYDIVLSFGFIEHFENYDEILDKHSEYLAPGGAMCVMIPNMRYLRKWYAQIVDSENLKIHNLKSMRLKVFKDFATRNNLRIQLLTYYGGFSLSVHQRLNPIQKFVYRCFRRLFIHLNPIIQKRPNRFLSSTIIAIYTKQ